MQDLFEKQDPQDSSKKPTGPLADRVRPQNLNQIVGQKHILGEDKILYKAIKSDQLFSMIFWGPPGVGKTTLARVIANETQSSFYSLSAVAAGVKEVRKVLEQARINLNRLQKRSILFIDEIHRFNKAQQDVLLHEVEDGTIILIGATTENPSFEVNSPLLSRCRVFQIFQLEADEIREIIDNALSSDQTLNKLQIDFSDSSIELLIRMSSGDARVALSALELAVSMGGKSDGNEVKITNEILQQAFQSRSLYYDKNADYHYDVISAFIKSVRGSDPDAALHWLARMIDAGEKPEFIARRMIILASEDIGNADPQAIVVATSGFTAVTYIGMPEAKLVLAQVVTYLASAPKSNASYLAIQRALEDVKTHKQLAVPLHLRNAPTPLMKTAGYGEDYKYPHNFENNFTNQEYLPKELADRIYYHPSNNGYEKQVNEYLIHLWQKRRNKNAGEK